MRAALTIALVAVVGMVCGRSTALMPVSGWSAARAIAAKQNSELAKCLTTSHVKSLRVTSAPTLRPALAALGISRERAFETLALVESGPPERLIDQRRAMRRFLPRHHRPSALPDA